MHLELDSDAHTDQGPQCSIFQQPQSLTDEAQEADATKRK